ncbi:hypothetical protein ACFVXG_20425 [Kitasatospora sp. NPDC058162]|uniref:hypothetical protein n=1 Tax=Kitasatospora sp. NPDC058162 TaxID=3346362 RepID=UPI0036DA20D6
MTTYALTSGGIGPGRRWGWLLTAAERDLGYRDGVFDSDPAADARAAQAWADDLLGTPQTWVLTARADPCGPRRYTAQT